MEALGIDGKLLLAQAINFIIFYFIFNKYISKPFSKFLKKEQSIEQEKHELLMKLRSGEEQRLEEETKMKKEMKRLAEEEIKKARTDAEHIHAEIVAKAQKEAAEIIKKGHEQIASERQQLHSEVKKNIGEMSMILISKGLNEYLSPELKKDLTRHILNNLDSTRHS